MDSFKLGEVVTVEGTVLRTREGRVELQLRDGQLLRVPFEHARRAQSEEKAVQQAPENKGVARAPENKSARPKQNAGGGTQSCGRQRT